MGQKVNPTGFRTGITEDWKSKWFAPKAAYGDFLGEDFQVTKELLRVSGGLAAFSGFYFAISMLTDSTYREEFLSELTSEMKESFSERAEYLKLRAKASA